jgi:hypothetical protein
MVGEHIRTRRDGRWDHAIDCGDETVIHLADDAAGRSRVRRSYRPDFVSGAEVVEVVRHRERTFPASEIVARAYSRIADPALAAMFRDSEAFADWCATGRLAAGPASVPLEPAPTSAPMVKPPAAGPPPAAAKPRARAAPARRPGGPGAKAPKTRRAAKARGAAKRGARTSRPARKSAKRTTRGKARR